MTPQERLHASLAQDIEDEALNDAAVRRIQAEERRACARKFMIALKRPRAKIAS